MEEIKTPLGNFEDEIIESCLNFKFKCEPKNSLSVLYEILENYEKKLTFENHQNYFAFIEEILINQFNEQFPIIYQNTQIILSQLLEEELGNLLTLYENIKKNAPKISLEEIKKNFLDAFNLHILSNFENKIPKFICKPYFECLNNSFDFVFRDEAKNDLLKNYLKSFENSCLETFKNPAFIPFDQNILKISEKDRINIFLAIINCFVYANFNSLNKIPSKIIEHVFKICEFLPENELTNAEKEKLFNNIYTEKLNIFDKEDVFNFWISVLLSFLAQIDEKQISHFAISFFSILSGFYSSSQKFTKTEYFAEIRQNIKILLTKFVEHKNSDKIKENSLIMKSIEFKNYANFENLIGQFFKTSLFDFGKWNDYGEKNLLSIILPNNLPSNNEKSIYSKSQYLVISNENVGTDLFTLINLTPERSSTHVILCFSGFLSQFDDQEINWQQLISECPNSAIYAIKWASSSLSILLKPILIGLSSTVIKGMLSGGIGWAMSAISLSEAARQALKNFENAEKQAKTVGKLLAQIIINKKLFKDQCVSLIGFSLGTKAIISCLKELNLLKSTGNMINSIFDIVLLGGAAILRKSKIKNFSKCLEIVGGKVKNVFINSDWVLKLLSIIKKSMIDGNYPIGMGRIESMGESMEKVENYDVSGFVNGHLRYRAELAQIIRKIEFE